MTNYLKGNLLQDYKTLDYMMQLYCRAHHHPVDTLCDTCKALLHYSEKKLDRCPYGQKKPSCKNCPIHCYKPAEKEQLRQVMRYAGPRIIFHHPILAIRHIINDRKQVPSKPKAGLSNYHNRKKS